MYLIKYPACFSNIRSARPSSSCGGAERSPIRAAVFGAEVPTTGERDAAAFGTPRPWRLRV